jgi:putative FmdB family regulatory protein
MNIYEEVEMPIYEYRCKNCGVVFEARQKFSDAPLTECASCEGPVEKLISLSSFHLKGGGWHSSDYARKSAAPQKAEKSEKPAECKPGPSCGGCPQAS